MNNKSGKNESDCNGIFSPYCPLFNFFKNIGNNMINYLSYEDLVFKLREKKNILHQNGKHIKNNGGIILDNGYILLLLNFWEFYVFKKVHDFNVVLLLIVPDNQFKQILGLEQKNYKSHMIYILYIKITL